jgi:hypothetical protein
MLQVDHQNIYAQRKTDLMPTRNDQYSCESFFKIYSHQTLTIWLFSHLNCTFYAGNEYNMQHDKLCSYKPTRQQ